MNIKYIRSPLMSTKVDIIEEIHLTIPGETEKHKRSMMNRLFTLPWRPLEKYDYVTKHIPDPNYYTLMDNGCIKVVCHPSVATELRKVLNTNNPEIYKCQNIS